MDQNLKQQLSKDPDGLLTYEYIANHIGLCDHIMDDLIDNMIAVDTTGQYLVSAARYLHAIDAGQYKQHVSRLIAMAIEKDRQRCYLPDLLTSIWGDDYDRHVEQLSAADPNFRRISRRLFQNQGI